MVNGRDSRLQDLATVMGVFVLVCGGVLVAASLTSSQPQEPTPPEMVEVRQHAEEVSAAVREHDFERAKSSLEVMCAKAQSLERESDGDVGTATQPEPVTLAE